MAGGWQPIETAPRDGTLLLLWCDYEDAQEPAIARYVGRAGAARLKYGPFVWRELDGGGIAEKIPQFWKHIGKPRGARK